MTGSTPPHPVLDKYYSSDADRQSFVGALFDGAARHYNRIGTMLDLGSGPWYRRRVLRRAGLRPGMRLLDVATGTGLVARGAVRILGDPGRVIGIDPSRGMLREARKALASPLVQGRAEALPFRDDLFDMLSMGFALRHVPDLDAAFREYRRVLKPGGRLLLLEVSRPRSPCIPLADPGPFPARPALDGANQHQKPAGPAPHEILLGHDRSVCAAGDDPRCLAA